MSTRPENDDAIRLRERPSRRAILKILAVGSSLTALSPVLVAQAPPPPPRPRGSVKTSGFLPTPTDIMYALRKDVTLDREEAVQLEQLIAKTLADQRRLLMTYGINADYERPDIRLSYRDAKQLNDDMDDLMDDTEDAADRILSATQMRAFKKLLRNEASARKRSIDAMRR
ncbi:MAG: hypothetical protein AAF574_01700 [Pseudomonadota bacterium]